MLKPIFLRYCKNERIYRLIDLGHLNVMFVVLVGVIIHQDGLGSNSTFIQIYYAVTLFFQHLYSLLHSLSPGFIILFLLRLDSLRQLDSLLLDFVNSIYFPQQSWIDSVSSEMSVKQDASSNQRLPTPAIKGFWAC